MQISACREQKLFLDWMIAWYEKWITYENIIKKRAYCESRKPAHLALNHS